MMCLRQYLTHDLGECLCVTLLSKWIARIASSRPSLDPFIKNTQNIVLKYDTKKIDSYSKEDRLSIVREVYSSVKKTMCLTEINVFTVFLQFRCNLFDYVIYF